MNTRVLVNLVILTGIIALGFFVYTLAKPETGQEKTSLTAEQEKVEKQKTNEEETIEEAPKETFLEKDGFSMMLPAGWEEVVDFPNVLAMAVDSSEKITDEQIEALSFRTNFSIKSDDLGKYDTLNNVEEYAQSIKDSLDQMVPGIEFISEEPGKINNNNAFFIECKSSQEEVDFKTLLVFVEGNNNAVWAISFNTIESSWPKYESVFYLTAESLELK